MLMPHAALYRWTHPVPVTHPTSPGLANIWRMTRLVTVTGDPASGRQKTTSRGHERLIGAPRLEQVRKKRMNSLPSAHRTRDDRH
jgi:hypothetical protein